jgi:hypothetical protein
MDEPGGAMVRNIKSISAGLTKETGAEESSAALAYAISSSSQASAHVNVQAASVRISVS